MLELSSETPIFPINWLTADITALVSDAQEYLLLFNERKENTINLLNRYDNDILKLNANDIFSAFESNMNDVNKYLNNTNFPSNKDIVLKADFILNECREMSAFLKNIHIQSKEISSILDVKQHDSISSIFDIKKLIQLILINPQSVEKWFEYRGVEKVSELLNIAEKEQFLMSPLVKTPKSKC